MPLQSLSIVNYISLLLASLSTLLSGPLEQHHHGNETNENYLNNLLQSLSALPTQEQDFTFSQIALTKELATNNWGDYNEDNYLNISQLANKYGFDFEVHRIVTEDGYVLGLHRIPNKGPPVLLEHGILESSDEWITPGPKSSLAYYLARKGYDVWMGNARGNKYSRKHVHLTPDVPEFWDFSWDEIGRFDFTATIDYVLHLRGEHQLNYVGYSQGNTGFYVMCSEYPEYNKKIKIHISMAPVTWWSHIFSPVLRILYAVDLFKILMAKGQYEFLPSHDFLSQLCVNDNKILNFLCINIGLYTTFGFDRGEFNLTNIPVFINHVLAGTSAKQFEHYRQSVYKDTFAQYDYGKLKNLERYGTHEPPAYPVHKVMAPVALFYSKSDYWSSYIDVVRLRKNLPNVVDFYELEGYQHIDYQFGRSVGEKVNPRIVKLIKKFS